MKIIEYLDAACERIKYLTMNGIGVSFAGERTPGFDFALDEDYDAFRHYEVGGVASLKMRETNENGREISDAILMLHRTGIDAQSHEEALAISLFRGYFKNMYFLHNKIECVSHSGAYSKKDAKNNALYPMENIADMNHVSFNEKDFIDMMKKALLECGSLSYSLRVKAKGADQLWEMIWGERERWPMPWQKAYAQCEQKCRNAIHINADDKSSGLTAFQLSSVSHLVMQLAMFKNDVSVIERYLSLVKREWVSHIERDKLMINHADLVSDCKKANAL